jgi:hypothetical protein
MALRIIISKALLPNMERELSGSIGSQVASVQNMVDCFLAPQAFAYEKSASHLGGAFKSTGSVQAPASTAAKVILPIQKEGLFQDQPAWHSK